MAKDNLQESFAFMLQDPNRGSVRPPFPIEKLEELAKQKILFGTSSWKYRGWEGIVYPKGYSSESQFQKQSLRDYAKIFPCVGLDSTYYSWPSAEAMSTLIDSTPDTFLMYPKVTKQITLREFPAHISQGKWAGKKNPDFLNVELFEKNFSDPIRILNNRLGIVIFEFTHLQKSDLNELRCFFEKISRNFPVALELRSPELVNEDFYRLLIDLDVIPAFNFWTKMPLVREQWKFYKNAGGTEKNSPLLIRALLKSGRTYEDAVQQFQPYSKIQDPFPEAHQDIKQLIEHAISNQRPLTVLVNNRFEGSAPYSIANII